MRGSDPDASLYWLARMLDGGADPLYVGRRLIRMATEDVGLADPRALRASRSTRSRPTSASARRKASWRSPSACSTSRCAPKSNAGVPGVRRGARVHQQDGSRPVPLRLRNAPTKLMKELGYGKGYRYAHDEPDAYAAGERYLPDGMPDTRFYEPTDRGLEQRIRDRLAALRERDAAASQPRRDPPEES